MSQEKVPIPSSKLSSIPTQAEEYKASTEGKVVEEEEKKALVEILKTAKEMKEPEPKEDDPEEKDPGTPAPSFIQPSTWIHDKYYPNPVILFESFPQKVYKAVEDIVLHYSISFVLTCFLAGFWMED